MQKKLTHERPMEFLGLLDYILVYAPQFPVEDEVSNAEAFAQAFEALEFYISRTPTEEGREKLRQCVRNLEFACEFFEADQRHEGCALVQETEEMFKKARKYIAVPSWSD